MNVYAKYNQSAEDYLESILTLSKIQPVVHRIDIAKRMGVSQAAVNKAVKLLCDKQFVYEEGKHLYLTASGREYAESVYEKHCVIREFLISLGVCSETAEQDACHMEHLLSQETIAIMQEKIKK